MPEVTVTILAESARLRRHRTRLSRLRTPPYPTKINSAPPCTPRSASVPAPNRASNRRKTSSLPRAGSRTESRIGPYARARRPTHAKDQPVQPDHAPLHRVPDCGDGEASRWNIFSIRVRDRFGDHGIVGVAITHDQGDHVSRYLPSKLPRHRPHHRNRAPRPHRKKRSERGCKRLVGRFLPTKKNAPARDFYSQHKFGLVEKNGEGSLWSLDLTPASALSRMVKLSRRREHTIDRYCFRSDSNHGIRSFRSSRGSNQRRVFGADPR